MNWVIGIGLIVIVICVIYILSLIILEFYGFGLLGKPVRLREKKLINKDTGEIKLVEYIIEAKSTIGVWIEIESGPNLDSILKRYEGLAKEIGKKEPVLVSESNVISNTETELKIEYNGK